MLMKKIREKYLDKVGDENKNLSNYLNTMTKQIKQIENLVNEFSDFARMPKPLYQKNKFIKLITSNIELLKKLDTSIKIHFNYRTPFHKI